MSAGSPKGPADAEARALEWLAQRPLTEAELSKKLRTSGIEADDVESLCARLRRTGYLDDLRLARHFIATRAARLGLGPRRLLEELVRRGLVRGVAQAALDAAAADGEFAPDDELARRVARATRNGAQRLDRRAQARLYQALVRAGFEDAAIRRAIAAVCEAGEDDEFEPGADEGTDKFA